jgi:glycosyltransferase involved in cell wall biosynthesis
LVDTQNPQSKLWGSVVAGLTGVALVSTLNSWYGTEHRKGSWRGRLYSILELGTNFFLDRYVVVSRAIRDALIQHGVAPDKIDLIYNAVETDQTPKTEDGEAIISSLKLPPDRIVLVAAGRLTWAKGYEDLIRALALMIKEDDRVFCLVAGAGELLENLKTLIEQEGLSRHIILLGHVSRDKILSLIAAGDIFVMPSRSEGTPIALLEAASLKKPILATTVGGIPELVKNEEECLLVEAGNVSELVNGMKRLIQDKALSERLGESAHSRVLRDFSLDVQARATIQTYNRALQALAKRT